VASFFRRKVIDPFKNFLNLEAPVYKLALSITFGMVFGIFPFPWVGTILCTLVVPMFRLNFLFIQFVNYAVYLLQLGLFVPFILYGQYLFDDPPISGEIGKLTTLLKTDFVFAVTFYSKYFLHAAAAWLLIAFPMSAIIYSGAFLLISWKRKRNLKK